ncbi:hypothetical protein LBMAG52_01280 [Planctomycetia bacterium]|nr:hypothetical protein LBMAG52_01280 [Planctomycetia bacterium]
MGDNIGRDFSLETSPARRINLDGSPFANKRRMDIREEAAARNWEVSDWNSRNDILTVAAS